MGFAQDQLDPGVGIGERPQHGATTWPSAPMMPTSVGLFVTVQMFASLALDVGGLLGVEPRPLTGHAAGRRGAAGRDRGGDPQPAHRWSGPDLREGAGGLDRAGTRCRRGTSGPGRDQRSVAPGARRSVRHRTVVVRRGDGDHRGGAGRRRGHRPHAAAAGRPVADGAVVGPAGRGRGGDLRHRPPADRRRHHHRADRDRPAPGGGGHRPPWLVPAAEQARDQRPPGRARCADHRMPAGATEDLRVCPRRRRRGRPRRFAGGWTGAPPTGWRRR